MRLISRTQIASKQKRLFRGRTDIREGSAMGLDEAFLGDGKTCLNIMDTKEKGDRTGNLEPNWVDLVCHIKKFAFRV